MANIYVTPLLSPSFERFPNHSASEIQNDQFPTIGDHRVEPKDKEDENANKSIPHACKTATDTREACGITSHGTNSLDCIKGGKSDAQHHLQNVTTANELGRTFVDLKYDETTGNDVISRSSTKSSLELQLSLAPQSSGLEKSPVYCFHSFTYGVGGSSESLRDKSKESTLWSNSSSWQGESYDGDSPFVQFTRTVVDPEDSGSPTILLDCDSESEEYLSHLLPQDQPAFKETDRKPPEGVQSKINYKVNFHSKATEISPEDVTKTPVMKRDSRTGDEEEAGQSARRPSPDGAECEDINTSGVECGIKVDRLVPGTEVRTGVGCSVGTPSGVLANCNYWIWDDGTEGKNIVDGEYLPERDQVSLPWPGKGLVRYPNEAVLQEMEKEALVSCFFCIRCVII